MYNSPPISPALLILFHEYILSTSPPNTPLHPLPLLTYKKLDSKPYRIIFQQTIMQSPHFCNATAAICKELTVLLFLLAASCSFLCFSAAWSGVSPPTSR